MPRKNFFGGFSETYGETVVLRGLTRFLGAQAQLGRLDALPLFWAKLARRLIAAATNEESSWLPFNLRQVRPSGVSRAAAETNQPHKRTRLAKVCHREACVLLLPIQQRPRRMPVE